MQKMKIVWVIFKVSTVFDIVANQTQTEQV